MLACTHWRQWTRSRMTLSFALSFALSLSAACVPPAERAGPVQVFDRNGQAHEAAEHHSPSPALPKDAAPYEVRAVGGSKYLVKTWSQGSFLLERGALTALRGLPRSKVWRDDGKVVYRELRDMKELVVPVGYPSSQIRPILALNDNDLLISTDGAKTFRRWRPFAIEPRTPSGLAKQNLLLSVVFWQDSATVLDYSGQRATPGLCAAVGTSQHGVFISCDGGFTWSKKREGLPGLPSASPIWFYESIRALHVDLTTKTMYAGTELGRGAYRSALSAETAFTPIALGRFAERFARDKCSINAISSSATKLYLSGDCEPLLVRTDHGTVEGTPLWPEPERAYVSFYRYFAQHAAQPSSIDSKVAFHADAKGGFYTYDNPSAIPKRSKRAFPFEPGECRGFYISTQSSMTKLDKVRALLDSGKFNCVVVDMKDDFGRVPMEVTTPLTERYGTRRSDWSISELSKLLSGYKVWKVARHVTMKDLHLVDATDGRLALLDIQTHKPWVGDDQDKWSDPYNQEVWQYNAQIASTYEALGFDEVQFDYIRFPSDIDRFYSPAKTDDTYQSEALASFLRYARTKTRLPVSIDIFGLSALYRTDSPIGQNLQLLAEYVDVISPMLYSSHFDHRSFAQGNLDERAYYLLLLSTGRANVLARGRVVIRNWLQAFREQTELWGYGHPYFQGQMQGSLDGGSKGWMWWGPIEEMFGLP